VPALQPTIADRAAGRMLRIVGTLGMPARAPCLRLDQPSWRNPPAGSSYRTVKTLHPVGRQGGLRAFSRQVGMPSSSIQICCRKTVADKRPPCPLKLAGELRPKPKSKTPRSELLCALA